MKMALPVFMLHAVLGVVLCPCALAADPAATMDLENTLAGAIATYDPGLSAPAAADYENSLLESQLGDGNIAIGAQLQVDSSTGTIAQNGSGNLAGVFQVAGSGGRVVINQTGSNNYVSAIQAGPGNAATLNQQNDNNYLVLNQQNGNNIANITQYGNSHVTLNQNGFDTANLTFTVTTPSPVSYTYSQSPGSSWTINVVN
jgi:hypothetical protein